MAKTLIGNVKGKDGRGIASISKTGTTGSVDTYTIKYTDGTTSTYTVNNSDSVSLQRQIVPSAAVESSATASQAYSAGDYVVVNGVLRKVNSAIAKGNAISDSNSTATTVGGELATIGDSVSRYKSTQDGAVWARIDGGVVTVWSDLSAVASSMSAWTSGVIGKLPKEFSPASGNVGGCAYAESSTGTGIIPVHVDTNGEVRVLTRGLTLAANWKCSFSVTYGARQ